jgi:hypothetical protein
MCYDDMELLRKFLVKENDAGNLNLNKLCIVGAEMGASVASYYAAYDWTTVRREANRRPAPSQDVKGLFLISPDWDFKGPWTWTSETCGLSSSQPSCKAPRSWASRR